MADRLELAGVCAGAVAIILTGVAVGGIVGAAIAVWLAAVAALVLAWRLA